MRIIEANVKTRKAAKIPHEVFTSNAVVVHLFFTLGLIKLLDVKMDTAIALSILLSVGIIIWTYFRAKIAKARDTSLIYLHWQLSLNRYKILVSAYVFYFLVTSLSLLSVTDTPMSMDGTNIVDSILTLLGVVPLFFAVLICVVLGSGSMFNAGRGEIDEKFAQKYE